MVAAILLACGALTLVRTNGITGDADSDFEWRWTPTAEERLLAPTLKVVHYDPQVRTVPNPPDDRARECAHRHAGGSGDGAARDTSQCEN